MPAHRALVVNELMYLPCLASKCATYDSSCYQYYCPSIEEVSTGLVKCSSGKTAKEIQDGKIYIFSKYVILLQRNYQINQITPMLFLLKFNVSSFL